MALRALYGMSVGNQSAEDALASACDELEISEESRMYAFSLVAGVQAHKAELDAQVAALAEGYTVERLAAVDFCILRIAAYEIFHADDVPPAVAINEAVDLAKKYSTDASGPFINGILGNLVRKEGMKTHGDRD
jgi:N utilization substance protein B